MNLTRCKNGHFYDMDKYSSCPHCSGQSASNDENDMDVTGPYNRNETSDTGRTTSYEDDSNSDIWDTPTEFEPEKRQGINVEGLFKDRDAMTGEATGPFVDDAEKTQRFSPTQSIHGEPVVGWLVCVSGEHAGESYTLRTGKNFIGRAADMDVILPYDKSISRVKHAIVLYEPRKRQFLVQPGESRELFYLNDEVVLNMEQLNAYDRLLIGKTELIFVPLCGEKFSWDEQKEEKDKA